MDELDSGVIFSKLDFGYAFNQLRIGEGEEFKTTFKTHSGHFEYLVMSFGLTNSIASFQYLMNHVFQHFLRKFVIIFFDDIHVYNTSLEEHIDHLAQVFGVVNQFFLKKEKCHFAT